MTAPSASGVPAASPSLSSPRFSVWRSRLAGGLVPVVLVLLWFLLARLGALPAAQIPSPGEVARAFGEELRTGRLLTDITASLWRVALGYLLGAGVGIPLGLLLGLRLGARAALLPTVNFLRSLSPIPWLPFAVLWFGIGDAPVVFLLFLAVFPPLCLTTAAAVAGVPKVYYRVARDYDVTGIALLTEVVVPAVLPQIITALRVAAGTAWVVLVAAEMVAGSGGLGQLIYDARNGLRMDLNVMAMAVIGTIGAAIDVLMSRLTRLPSVRWGYER